MVRRRFVVLGAPRPGRLGTLPQSGCPQPLRRAALSERARGRALGWSTAPSSSHVSVPTSRPIPGLVHCCQLLDEDACLRAGDRDQRAKDSALRRGGCRCDDDRRQRQEIARLENDPYRSPRCSRPRTARGDRSRTTSPRCTKLVHERSDLSRLASILLVRSQPCCLGRERAVAPPIRRLHERLPDRLRLSQPCGDQLVKRLVGVVVEPDGDRALAHNLQSITERDTRL